MLWIQYEANENINPQYVEVSLGKIAELIAPYPVAAFDTGRFGIGLLVSDPDFSDNDFSDDSRPSTQYNSREGENVGSDLDGESFRYLPDNVTQPESDETNTKGSVNERGKCLDNVAEFPRCCRTSHPA